MRDLLKHSTYFVLVYFLISCKTASQIVVPVAKIPVENTPIILPDSTPIQASIEIETATPKSIFEDWKIFKKSIGPISVGMNLYQADSILENFKKSNALAEDFGFSGGSPAYIYSMDDVPILAIVPTMYHNKVFAIVALSEKLQTESGAHPQISLDDLLKIYPQIKIYNDPINGWECAEDAGNQWDFIFISNKINIGNILSKNRNGDILSKILNTWIAVR